MSYWLLLGVFIDLVLACYALVLAAEARQGAPKARIQRLELDLIELSDLYDGLAMSIKKLHGRSAVRASREKAPESDDPMARLPGETGDQWKARMGRLTFNGRRSN